jgi:lysophospholipase L1-like esterase
MVFAVSASARADDPPPFELLDGDRVVFVGNTFIERDQVYGYLETMLTARWPDRHITFRNFGWSGDTVWGEARARFGTAADGFQHLKEHVESIKPTVIFVGYGANESFEGEPGLTRFEKGLNDLLDMLVAAAAPNVRVVLFPPTWREKLGQPLPYIKGGNEQVRRYGEAIRRISDNRGHIFIDLMSRIRDPWNERAGPHYTDNGLHLNAYGYWLVAVQTMWLLGADTDSWEIHVTSDARVKKTQGVQVTNLEKLPNGLRFNATAERLPLPLRPKNPTEIAQGGGRAFGVFHGRTGNVFGLKAGTYEIRIDDRRQGTCETPNDRPVFFEYEEDRIEQLRQAIVEKNRLYFHRWRPQNETYLFGFRKHEQGQNAAEVPKFDRLVEELESKIAKLRVPVKHTYELIRVDE